MLHIIKHKESREAYPSVFEKYLRVQYLIVEMLFRQSVNYFTCKEMYSVNYKFFVLIFETKNIITFWIKCIAFL